MSLNTSSTRLSPLRLTMIGLNYLIVVAMMVCFAASLNQVAQRLFAGWDNSTLVWISAFIAIEALVSNRLIASLRSFTWVENLVYRGSETVLVVLLLKALLLLAQPGQNLAVLLSLWQQDFLTYFFTSAFIGIAIFSAVIWLVSTAFSSQLFHLEENPEVLVLERQGYIRSDRAVVRRQLMALIFGFGAVMLVISALLRLDLSELEIRTNPVEPLTINLVIYFTLGMLLIGLSHYAVMRSRWYIDRIPVTGVAAPRWLAYSLVAFAIAALLAILLPTRFSLGLFSVLQVLLGFFGTLLVFLQFIILSPIIFLFSLIARLLAGDSTPQEPLTPPQLPQITPTTPAAPIPWLEVLKSLAFWAIFLGIILASLYYYFKQRGGFAEGFSRSLLGSWIAAAWAWLIKRFRRTGGQVGAWLGNTIKSLRPASTFPGIGPGDLAERWGHLPPRKQVMRIYLSMLRLAGQNGVKRSPGQTPNEFAQRLDPLYPEVRPEVDQVTASFVEARYTKHAISPQQAGWAQRCWERLQAGLREPRKPK